MKLTNPTDDQLNAAFAEKIAAWREVSNGPLGWDGIDPDMPRHFDGNKLFSGIPSFTTSADAVLPWLEKMAAWKIETTAYSRRGERVYCKVWPRMTQTAGADIFFEAFADAVPRAAVFALLRAHGVAVEFTP